MSLALSWRLVEEPEDLGSLRGAWDELAVAAAQPFSAPGWALAWWRHLRPDGAQLRLLAVLDGEQLAGLVPLYAQGHALLPLAAKVAAAEPLAAPGREQAVAALAATALAELAPATVTLELADSSFDWSEALGGSWPGRGARRWAVGEVPLPRVDLGEGFEQWLQGKSSSFRRETKRKRRKLEEAGGGFRFASAETLRGDVAGFMRLHRDRLANQGGSSLTDDGVERMLVEVGAELLASGRFRLLCMEIDGKLVAAQLLMAAGRELSAWNSGFDEAYSKFSPSMQCLTHALADGSERGERTMSLGPGAQDYKYRLSTEEDSVVSRALIPIGGGYPVARARLAGRQMRSWLGRTLGSGSGR